jgi:hypothetical protein
MIPISKDGVGFVTFAQNTDLVDYLKLAYVQACNIKSIHKTAKCAVIVDKPTYKSVTESCRQIFDFIILIEHDNNLENSTWKLANEYQIFELSPFKETIKLEADILFTRPIDHWLNSFRFRDVVLSLGCKNYRQRESNVRTYRHFFDQNDLPDVYSGLMYFRFSLFAQRFFDTARQIFNHWDYIKINLLKNCREDTPSTDVLYALTAKMLGVENCTLPSFDFIKFVHMKPSIAVWSDVGDWQNMTMVEHDENMIRIHNLNQYDPVHYHEKTFINNQKVEYYERRYDASRIN